MKKDLDALHNEEMNKQARVLLLQLANTPRERARVECAKVFGGICGVPGCHTNIYNIDELTVNMQCTMATCAKHGRQMKRGARSKSQQDKARKIREATKAMRARKVAEAKFDSEMQLTFQAILNGPSSVSRNRSTRLVGGRGWGNSLFFDPQYLLVGNKRQRIS